MKKLVSILSILILSVGSIMAQKNYRTITGYVVDKNGNPIPGAEVTTPGGGESVITDADGSFSMSVHPLLKKLSATYDGMTTKTIKLTPENKDFVFTLKKERKNPVFLNAVIGYSGNIMGSSAYDDRTNALSWGLMVGMLGKWGFYGKGSCDWYGNFSTTVGVIKSIYKRTIFMYVGIGYGMVETYYTYQYHDSSFNYYTGTWDWRGGIATDLGFIFKTGRHFNLTIGYNLISTLPFTGHNYVSVGSNYVHGLQLGFGYVF